jgi:adenylylsulfate kinase
MLVMWTQDDLMKHLTRFDARIAIGHLPHRDDLPELSKLGYVCLVDVRAEREKSGDSLEKSAVALGLRYVTTPLSRDAIELDDVVRFCRVVYDRKNGPLYAFSRFGKKPLAFLVLLEAVANEEPLPRVFQRASRLGVDLRGDTYLESFLIELFNSGQQHALEAVARELRPELFPGEVAAPASLVPPMSRRSLPPRYVSRDDRESLTGQRGCTVWLTGLPSAGKTTTALALEAALFDRGHLTHVLDADNIRHGLNSDLDFTVGGRTENIRRIAHVARLVADAGLIVVTSFISPFRRDRELARSLHTSAGLGFVEVFVDTPAELCARRDPQNLYKLAREGEIPSFTGVDSPYEPPLEAALVVHPDQQTPDQIANAIVEHLHECGYLGPGGTRGPHPS